MQKQVSEMKTFTDTACAHSAALPETELCEGINSVFVLR